jgi:EAL domain-containing protein (putative c-di-GMP-specific phosphodiesterase class I)
MDLFAADGSPGSSSAITPPGGSLLIKAWQTGTVQSRHSFKQEVPGEYWSALLGEPAQHMGVRAAVHVPVLDGKNSSVALLIMLGGTPNQFGSAFMRQFARNLQQRWSEIWQRGSRPPPAVPQELAISYRERLFNGGLRMYVQPVIDLRDWRLVKAEALARLELADGRMLAPSEFLPLLSQVEIDRLFRMGLDQALKALVGWEAQGLCLDIAINLPPHTLADPACAQWVFEAVTRHGVVPHRLTMEMLESQHVNEDARDAGVQRLLALGVHLAMDDLGSGYSSLRRLASLPFSSIKVDQDLLKRIHSEPVATISLISAVVQMGRDFGCDVVVEGLEEPGMIEVARLLGAHLGQGYGIARPMPAADLVRWNSNFRCTDRGQSLQTYLGALAFQWSSIRHRSMHASILEACPMTTVLKEMGMDAGDVNRLHECAHRDPHNATVARELLDCLESIVRGQEPPPA